MLDFDTLRTALVDHWPVWVVTVTLVVAAVIDGWLLKVPNWLTFPMIILGWAYSAGFTDYPWYEGLAWSLAGTAVGLGLLLPLYSIGGMGAGDVKLLAGVGAWVWSLHTLYAFVATAVVGAALSVLLVLYKRTWSKHQSQFFFILSEILTVRDPNRLSVIAAERKSSMQLLPYGIPIAIGSILYFALGGMLL